MIYGPRGFCSPECDVLVMGKASSADEHVMEEGTPKDWLACSLFTGFGTSRNLCYVALWLYFLLDVQIAMAASSTLSPVNAICFRCNVHMLSEDTLLDYLLLDASSDGSPECDVLVMGKASSADEHVMEEGTPKDWLACSLFTGFGTSRNLCYVALWLYFLLDVQIAMAASSTLSPVNAICFRCNVHMLSEDTLLDYLLLDASSDGSMIILGDISRGGMALADSSLGNLVVHSSAGGDSGFVPQYLAVAQVSRHVQSSTAPEVTLAVDVIF